MPLAPLGTKALVYNNPATRASLAPHASDGFYIGTANNHYCCLCFYIPSTQCFHFVDTWWLSPAHCQVPVTSEQGKTLLAVANLFEQLGQTILTTASAKLKHLVIICQLSTCISGQLNFPPPLPTSPRVESDTSEGDNCNTFKGGNNIKHHHDALHDPLVTYHAPTSYTK
jgi:hypothetical protein